MKQTNYYICASKTNPFYGTQKEISERNSNKSLCYYLKRNQVGVKIENYEIVCESSNYPNETRIWNEPICLYTIINTGTNLTRYLYVRDVPQRLSWILFDDVVSISTDGFILYNLILMMKFIFDNANPEAF